MLNVNINYPYPVIREYIEDYKNTIFTGKLTVQLESEGYVIIHHLILKIMKLESL